MMVSNIENYYCIDMNLLLNWNVKPFLIFPKKLSSMLVNLFELRSSHARLVIWLNSDTVMVFNLFELKSRCSSCFKLGLKTPFGIFLSSFCDKSKYLSWVIFPSVSEYISFNILPLRESHSSLVSPLSKCIVNRGMVLNDKSKDSMLEWLL